MYQFEITGEPQEQNLSVQFSPATGIVGDVLNISATPGESGNAVTLASSTAETCSMQGSSVTLLKEGTCTVTATQAGNSHYLAASASSSVTVKTNKATFNLTVSSNKDNSGELTQVSQADTVNIELQVTAAVKDVGKTAELFLTVKLGNDQYILTDKGWQPWDGVTWTRVTQQALTSEAITLPVFSGQLTMSGTLEFSAAYRVAGSSALSQGPQPVGNLTVIAFNPVEQAKTDCLGKGGIYYAQQCFTDVKDLGNGFAGGIYVEGQLGLQTNANLACRLGKKVAVLGRFNVSDDDVGKPAEVVFAFQNNLDNATGKTIGAFPKIYGAALFEGELPTTGTLPVSFGYRLLNSEGSKGVLKSATGLTFAVSVDSCDNPDLQLVTSPLGTGKGEVITKTNEDGSVRLVAVAATDGSQFAGWTGDAEGCKGSETTVTIKPTADKFTCQPTFSKQVLGTSKCVNGFDTEQNIACCDLKDPQCPAIPEPCNPPKDSNVKWVLNIPSYGEDSTAEIRFTNLSDKAQKIRGTLYHDTSYEFFAGRELGTVAPFATFIVNSGDLLAKLANYVRFPERAALAVTATDPAKLSIVNLQWEGSDISDFSGYTRKHRLFSIPPPSSTDDEADIRITNIGNTRVVLRMRMFQEDGSCIASCSGAALNGGNELAPKATLVLDNKDIADLGFTWATGRAWAEIFPEQVEDRCDGQLLMQMSIRTETLGSLLVITPHD